MFTDLLLIRSNICRSGILQAWNYTIFCTLPPPPVASPYPIQISILSTAAVQQPEIFKVTTVSLILPKMRGTVPAVEA